MPSLCFHWATLEFDNGVIFLNQSRFSTTHGNQWDCLVLCRQQITSTVVFFFCLPEWAKGGFPVTVERYWFRTERFYCISLLLSYIQVDSMLTCACSIIDRRWHQNVVRKSETHSAVTSCATFLFLPRLGRHLWSIKQLDFYQVTVDESAGRANWPSTEIKNECFNINLLVVQNFNLNPLQRRLKNAKKCCCFVNEGTLLR